MACRAADGVGMRREPSLTFQGALKILGRDERRWLKALDNALGGAILAAGVGAGVAAVGPHALAPAGMFAAVWGWVEQKGLAVDLLGQAVAKPRSTA
jgi:NACHT N-terminal Helical domain 7